MTLRQITAGIVLTAAASSSMAITCDGATTTWGSLGPPGLAGFGNSFSSANTYHDCYTFTLNSTATSFGGYIELDSAANKLNIDSSVSLYANGTLLTDTISNPLAFSYSGLAGGVGTLYTLVVDSLVTNATNPGWLNSTVGYLGAITTIAAPTPEPSTLALMLAGLLGIGTVALRRRA